MASWKKTITSPFRKACTFFNQQPAASKDKKSQPAGTYLFNLFSNQDNNIINQSIDSYMVYPHVRARTIGILIHHHQFAIP